MSQLLLFASFFPDSLASESNTLKKQCCKKCLISKKPEMIAFYYAAKSFYKKIKLKKLHLRSSPHEKKELYVPSLLVY